MNEELTAAEHNAIIEDINNIVPSVIDQLVAIADKHNVVRDDLICYFGKIISSIIEISTFKNWDGSGYKKDQDFCDESTASLVEKLKNREGVETHIAEPYADLDVKVNGPAIVLVVTD